jgi:two-component system aerobic respiration control sensor histidine kinase ArcB
MDSVNERILLVEDNESIQMFHSYMVRKLNYEVDMALTGQEALDFFEKNKYAAILMDVGLPDMLGIEVTQYIRERERTCNLTMTPVIMVTSYSIQDVEAVSHDLDIKAIISKPITIDVLRSLLKK